MGAELGVKAGRSYFFYLNRNKQLHMTGLDLWEDQPNSPYKENAKNGEIAMERNKPFANRSVLYKGDAVDIATQIKDGTLDFVFYDLYNFRISTVDFHKRIIAPWLPKIKPGGVLIGRDFHEPHIVQAIQELVARPITPVLINGKPHIRLKQVML